VCTIRSLDLNNINLFKYLFNTLKMTVKVEISLYNLFVLNISVSSILLYVYSLYIIFASYAINRIIS